MSRNISWIKIILLVLALTTACSAGGNPTPIPINNASPKSSNHEIEPTSVDIAWQTDIILKLGTKPNVLWDVPEGAQCFTEQLGWQHIVLTQEVTYDSSRYKALYVDGDNVAVRYQKNEYGSLKRYELKDIVIKNADGTTTQIQEGFDRSLMNCKDTEEASSFFSMSHLFKCSLRTTTTTYRDWEYVVHGFCKGTGAEIKSMKPQPKSIVNIPSEAKEMFRGVVDVKLNGVTVGTFDHRDRNAFTANCKVVLSPQESVLGVNCYK